MPRIENWSVVMDPDATPYQAPELRSRHLHGECSDHPVYPGKHGLITTSRLVAFDAGKGLARTLTGTVYELGTPDEKWIAWLEASGLTIANYNKGVPNEAARQWSLEDSGETRGGE